MTDPIIKVSQLSKIYDNGFEALKTVDLAIRRGEILALLGPNGAGKTTLISTICGIVSPSQGSVSVDGYDISRDYRKTRALIGLVPQELYTESFESVMGTVRFSRGLFGKPPDPDHLARILQVLSLWDKRDSTIMTLSGGMKRRVMIAKALSHDPKILFLDEPTAGVDVELRKDMWQTVQKLRDQGVTIILTTHYIEEAQAIADRVGIINKGQIMLVDETKALMETFGKKELVIELSAPADADQPFLHALQLRQGAHPGQLVRTWHSKPDHLHLDAAEKGEVSIAGLLNQLEAKGLHIRDVSIRQSSLEEVFINLLREQQ